MRQLRADGWLRGRIILPGLLVSAFVVVFVWGFVLTGRYAVDSTHAEHATQVSSSFPQRLWATLSLFTGGYLSLTPDYDPQPPTDLSIVGILALLLTLFAAGSLVLLSRRVRDFVHLVRPKAHLGIIGDGHTAAALIKSSVTNNIPTILITESRDSVAAMATTPAIPIIAAGELQAVLTTPTARRVISHAKRVVIATDSDGVNMQLHDEIQVIRAGQSEKYRGRTDLVIIHDPVYAELVRPDTITTTLPGNEVTCPAENIAEHICHLIVAAITGSPRIQRAVVDVVDLPASTTTDQDQPGLAETIRIWVRRLSWSLSFVCDDDEIPVPQIVLREPGEDNLGPPKEPGGLTIQIFTGPSSTSVAAAALPRRHALRIAVANRQLIAGAAKLRYLDDPQTVTTGREWLADGKGLGDHPEETLQDLLLVVDPAETGLDAALVTDDTGTQWARTFSLTHTLMFSNGTWSVVGWQPGAPMGESTQQQVEEARRASLDPGRIQAAKAKTVSQGRAWDETAWRESLLREAKKKIGDRYSSKLAVDHMLTLLAECGFELQRHDGVGAPPGPAMPEDCQKYIAWQEHQDWLDRTWTDSSRYPWTQKPPWRAPEEVRLATFSGVAANEFCYAGLVALENDDGWNTAQHTAQRLGRTLNPNLRKAARYNRRIATETYPAIAASFGYAIVPAGTAARTAPEFRPERCGRPLCPCRTDTTPRTLDPAEVGDLLADASSYRSRIVVRAEPISAEANWDTARADSMRANTGDWWVTDGDAGWSVAADVFAQTYEHVDGDRYRKTAPVHAVQLAETVLVQTLEGTATGQPGDWLVRNPGGECWPVTGADFARRYERV
ncbi:hypothetical protein MINS_13260 [Mycolicibacterium insubricum]|uniref:hypothetical protein n=1 Tax=Mycolicibacterium insubricum TaxID=444597 RepID=UPI0009F21462|nr:hypothetical protein [Mycolicibacterium insubricum]BBZ65897.1 hypothetical protein MINS_13260 [Mycolicibacterium insubricum]